MNTIPKSINTQSLENYQISNESNIAFRSDKIRIITDSLLSSKHVNKSRSRYDVSTS